MPIRQVTATKVGQDHCLLALGISRESDFVFLSCPHSQDCPGMAERVSWPPQWTDLNPLDCRIWWQVESQACPSCPPNIKAHLWEVGCHAWGLHQAFMYNLQSLPGGRSFGQWWPYSRLKTSSAYFALPFFSLQWSRYSRYAPFFISLHSYEGPMNIIYVCWNMSIYTTTLNREKKRQR